MAGTFAEQATLANDNAMIDKCRVAMLFRANELLSSQTAQKLAVLQQAKNIVTNAGADAPSMAWKLATGNATIAAAAPAVPSDGDVQFSVNVQLVLDIS